MIQKDYIMRMIEQFTEAIAIILKLKTSHQYEDALSVINQTLQKLVGLNSKTINSLSTESIINLLKLRGLPDTTKFITWITELIKEEAEVYEFQGNHEISKSKYLKALELYLKIISLNESNVSNYFSKIKEIIDKLKQYNIINKTKYNFLIQCEKNKNYSKIKNLLSELVEK
jgi:hypothetical protein